MQLKDKVKIMEFSINQSIKNIPQVSGIYLFKDKNDKIIYIGKAKNLRKRISSYFKKREDNIKVQELIKEYNIIDHIITNTETEALLLEAQLIQKFKPKYNTLLKSGTPFKYLEIINDKLEGLPKLVLSNKQTKNSMSFGPFLFKGKIRSVYDYLTKTFKLSLCNKRIQNGCLDYHLGICAGNCKSEFDIDSYKIRMKLVKELLRDDLNSCHEILVSEIKKYNKDLEFEKSKHLNNYLKNLDFISQTLKAKFSEDKYKEQIIIKTTPKNQMDDNINAIKELRKILEIDKNPINIDCFDISHFQGSYIVGSCIRFTYGVPDKNNFRRFKIKSLTDQNDYAALQEIVQRRYKDLKNVPDLILIDGGKGQLNAVKDLINNVKFISLAKREETLFSDNLPLGLKLDLKKDYARLLISLRDYAHHFAVSYHKELRSKNFIKDLA
ncbi:Excinuclease ABC subunit C [Candidatus Babela massiliensis]|uniref:Excinuclease ABC subunit C n=2 Tax=Candidatus Babela massiliensis TaxID=673862 RepID=V6DGV9_9BACT|nr:Excinuclease ABC subunit C [Candidatus Babela massiliensis]